MTKKSAKFKVHIWKSVKYLNFSAKNDQKALSSSDLKISKIFEFSRKKGQKRLDLTYQDRWTCFLMGFRSVTDGPNPSNSSFYIVEIRPFVAVGDLITLGNTPLGLRILRIIGINGKSPMLWIWNLGISTSIFCKEVILGFLDDSKCWFKNW